MESVKYKITAVVMALILTTGVFLAMPAAKVQAASDTLNLIETITTEKLRPEGVACPGDKLTVKVSMDNYADLEKDIKGIQLDVSINPNLFEFVANSEEKLLVDDKAVSYEIFYSKAENRLGLIYMSDSSNSLTRDNKDIMSFKVKVKDEVKEDTKIELPIMDTTIIAESSTVEIPYSDEGVPALTCRAFKPLMVQTLPDKTIYTKGQELDLTGGELFYTSEDGMGTAIDMTDAAVTVTGYDKAKLGEQTLTAVYRNEKTTFTITVKEKSVASIEVVNAPSPIPAIEGQAQTNYIEGQIFGIQDDGKLKVNYDNDTSEEIAITEDMVTAPDMDKAGATEVIVTYKDKTSAYSVTIEAKQALNIAAVPSKVEPKIETAFDPSIVSVKINYNNGLSDEIKLTEAMLNKMPDMDKVGEQVLTITYGGKTAALTVNVLDKELAGIEMKKSPDKIEFIEGTAFSAAGGEITLKYDNNTTKNKAIEDVMCTGYDMEKVGEQTVTVTYDHFTTTYKINVQKKVAVTGVKITPSEAVVTEGYRTELKAVVEPGNATNQKVNWQSSDSEIVTVDNGVITGVHAGTVKVTVITEDGSKTAECKVTVKKAVPVLDPDSGTAEGIVSGETGQNFVDKLKENSLISSKDQIRLLNTDGQEVSLCTKLTTGMKVEITIGSRMFNRNAGTQEYTVIVLGDISGDGIINILDMLAAQDDILGKEKLEGCYRTAGDITKDNNINIMDMLAIQDDILGKEKINPYV